MNESVSIATPDHVSLEFELAGPGSRFSAYAIDFLLNIILLIVIGLFVFLSGGLSVVRSLATTVNDNTGSGASWFSALLVFIIFLINWGYYIFFEGLGQGSTPGKRLVGIRVIRQDGLPVGLREAALLGKAWGLTSHWIQQGITGTAMYFTGFEGLYAAYEAVDDLLDG